MEFRLVLTESESPLDPPELELRWRIGEGAVHRSWARMAGELLASNVPIFPRFTGFPGPGRERRLLQRISWCIDTIHRLSDYRIKEHVELPLTQELANALHHHFELLAGTVEKPSPYLAKAGRELAHAILGLNHCVHDLELMARNNSFLAADPVNPGTFAAIIFEAARVERVPLSEEQEAEFDIETRFGDLVLHYSQIGKTWLEVFVHDDHAVSAEAILPHAYVTGECDIFFGTFQPTAKVRADLASFLRQRGQDPADPALRLGYCRIGTFERTLPLSNLEYQRLVGRYQTLRELVLVDEGGGKAIRRGVQDDYFLYRQAEGRAMERGSTGPQPSQSKMGSATRV